MRHLIFCLTLALLSGCAAPSASAPAPNPPPKAAPPASSAPATTAHPAMPATADTVAQQASDTKPEIDFASWRAAFAVQAENAGIRHQTVEKVLLHAHWLPEVVRLDRAQPEYTRTPWAYLDSAVSALRIQQGRKQAKAQAGALHAAAARYGVPASVITAIWGMESNYGSNFGDFSTVDALATLAFDGRRRSWAEGELLAALRILDSGEIPPARLLGSWAGAMGHTQFLPSVYLRYAVDADGDGRRDIWASVPDVVASTANYLASSGWRSDEPTYIEVQIPPGFDWSQAELNIRQSAAAWAAQGVRNINGAPLAQWDDTSILAPAGARGPALLVGANFRALLRYNNSNNYALAVALLAQRITGATGLQAAWPRTEPALPRHLVQQLQQALNALNLSAGTPDGVIGPATRAALRRYQHSRGLAADGFATQDLCEQIIHAHSASEPKNNTKN